MRHIFASIAVIIMFGLPWVSTRYPSQVTYVYDAIHDASDQLAAVVLNRNPKTIEEIQEKYDTATRRRADKVRVLIVPGHEPTYGGAEYPPLYERDMTVELANELKNYLSYNSRYEIFMTRNENGWLPDFSSYFENNWDAINEWFIANKTENINLRRMGQIKIKTPAVEHNSAPQNVAIRLYGISKWAGENDIDIIVHVHFNDYPRRNHKVPGKYSGFSIYVPERQYLNSTTTLALAEKIFSRLEKYSAVSNLPGESSGIIESQDLIAVGSYNTVDAPSMLIEYGYIYEPQFAKADVRSLAIKDLAFQTYLGIQDFFNEKPAYTYEGNDTAIMPYTWRTLLTENSTDAKSIYALQTALLSSGVYPPQNKTKNDCPRTGVIGACTKAALDSFQQRYGIQGEKGYVGKKTLEVLNSIYSVRAY